MYLIKIIIYNSQSHYILLLLLLLRFAYLYMRMLPVGAEINAARPGSEVEYGQRLSLPLLY
jgi:hypothetical protein